MTACIVILMAAAGAFMDALRGGMWRDDIYALGKPLCALVYGLAVLLLGGNALQAVLAAGLMYLGNAPGWGAYAGPAVEGLFKDGAPQAEIKVIDWAIKAFAPWPFLYGIAGLTLRGLLRSVMLAPVFVPQGGSVLLALSGAAMGLCFYIGGRIHRTDGNMGWRLGEHLTGAVLWGATGYTLAL